MLGFKLLPVLVLLFSVKCISAQYPEFDANMTRSGTTQSISEIDDVMYFMKLDYDADLIFARVNITKFDSGFYDCCVRIPNLVCSDGNILAEGWTSNITFRCISFLSVEYMLVFHQFNSTNPPVVPPIAPPIAPPTEPVGNQVITILLSIVIAFTGLFTIYYTVVSILDRIKNRKKKEMKLKKAGEV